MCRTHIILAVVLLLLPERTGAAEEAFTFQLQSQQAASSESGQFSVVTRAEKWQPSQTAVIVCDVWDYHHSPNAVRRLEEFLPRLNQVLVEARRRGATIIHSPSDCMAAYEGHPARRRATQAPPADHPPHDIASWCSMIPAEQRAVYPIDQSDGGADDDPDDSRQWAAHLKSLGRNPALPWQRQHDRITIDPETDYNSDRGDEVWNILKARGIQNVILTGVHTNMCVLGRPFGLRRLAAGGMHVVLMRDLTDTMYNPARWPYVSHFEGTRRVIAHIERYVCPTLTSDQVIGGRRFQFQGDDGSSEPQPNTNRKIDADRQRWSLVELPLNQESGLEPQSRWYRCVVQIPRDWVTDDLAIASDPADARMWCNGTELLRQGNRFTIPAEVVVGGDFHLIVIRTAAAKIAAPAVTAGEHRLELAGRWQMHSGDDPSAAGMPLPAKFGGSADIVFSPPVPLWTSTPLTRRGEFTKGIEGPACDRQGNVFAVNYGEQGTIGRVLPDGKGEVFLRLPAGSVGNGIRFTKDGSFFVADYTGHNILRIDPQTKAIEVYAHHADMNQPNDLALAPDGTLYASDPAWSEATGQLWRIDTDGTATRLADGMGTTNGIDVSPDGKTLYVNESVQRNVWSFEITEDRKLINKHLIRRFEDHGFHGMRCDVDGNLYITRFGKGTVVKMKPDGTILREVSVLGMRPSNLCFGGPDGCTVYVTEVEAARLVQFRVDRPGRSWAELQQ